MRRAQAEKVARYSSYPRAGRPIGTTASSINSIQPAVASFLISKATSTEPLRAGVPTATDSYSRSRREVTMGFPKFALVPRTLTWAAEHSRRFNSFVFLIYLCPQGDSDRTDL